MDECVLCGEHFDAVHGLKHPVCYSCSSKLFAAWDAYFRAEEHKLYHPSRNKKVVKK